MALETVLLALLGVVALWLVVDAGRERHRLRSRVQRSGRPRRTGVVSDTGMGTDAGWRYWPLTLPSGEDHPRR